MLAIVTGGTGGIGYEICRELKSKGYNVIATCKSIDTRTQTVNALEQYSVTVEEVDVTDFEKCNSFIKNLVALGSPPQILINNAGITKDSTLKKMSKIEWEQVIDVNLNGIFNMTKACIEPMIENKFGRIINISSVNGLKGQFGQCNYSATKAAIHGFTKSLAQEVAKKGVTVNCISPGYIETEMTAKIKPEILEAIKKQIPIGHLGKPRDIARVVSFLADQESSFITGSDFPINGGQV